MRVAFIDLFKRSRCLSAAKFALSTMIVLTLALASTPPANAAPAAPASASTTLTLTAAQARDALAVLNDSKRRAQISDALRAIAVAGTIATAPAAPAAGGSAPAAASGSVAIPLKSNALVRQLARPIENWFAAGIRQLRHPVEYLGDFGSIARWWSRELGTPAGMAQLRNLAFLIGGTLLPALFCEWLLLRAMRRPRRAMAARAREATVSANAAEHATAQAEQHAEAKAEQLGTEPALQKAKAAQDQHDVAQHWALLKRLPTALLSLVFAVIPLIGFAVVAVALAAVLAEDGSAPDDTLNALITGYVVARAVLIVSRFFFSPTMPNLRMVRMGDASAIFAQSRTRLLVLITAIGTAGTQAMVPIGLTENAHLAILKVIALVVHVLLSIVIIQCRRRVADWIRARTAVRPSLAYLGNWLADIWAIVAVFLVMALWFVWALDVQNGYVTLLHGLAFSILVLVLARVVAIVAYGGLGRLFNQEQDVATLTIAQRRAVRYVPLLRTVISVVIAAVTLIALLEIWGLNLGRFLVGSMVGHRLLSAVLTIGISAFIAVLIWEIVNATAERRLDAWSTTGDYVRAARLRTLLPMLRTGLLVAILLVVGLTMLSEIGVNTAPLLAGASIFGVALGFGSQKLVQDFITGIFLLMENAMQVGDSVTLAGVSGTVEYLSIRTVRLRGGDGSLFTVPFSSVTTVNNSNRGLGNAAVKVVLAKRDDVDQAVATLKAIGASLRADEAFAAGILGDFSYWGVDQIDGANITLVGQIQCKDTARWGVQREFNRRILVEFGSAGIELANPQRNFVIGLPEKEISKPATATPDAERDATLEKSEKSDNPDNPDRPNQSDEPITQGNGGKSSDS
jgi:small-conductance mechanosensitive channel